jgi:hypothetical protein
MGSGIMQCWINIPATDGIDDKIRMAYILLIRLRRTTIPLFHFRGKFERPKKPLYYQWVVEISRRLIINYNRPTTFNPTKGYCDE